MRAKGVVLMVAVWAAIAGCARDPLDRVVSVPTQSRFVSWRAGIATDSGAALRTQVEEALQEIRFSIAGAREARRLLEGPVEGGVAEIDEAVRQRVDGKPLREVLRIGYEMRVSRLRAELAGLEDAINKNSQLVTRPGDVESKHHLEGLRARQLGRVEKYREDLAAAERQLALFKKT